MMLQKNKTFSKKALKNEMIEIKQNNCESKKKTLKINARHHVKACV